MDGLGNEKEKNIEEPGVKNSEKSQKLEDGGSRDGWDALLFTNSLPGASNGSPMDNPTLPTGLHWAPIGSAR